MKFMYFKLNNGEVDFEVLRTQWGTEREVLQNFLPMIKCSKSQCNPVIPLTEERNQ
jgi:hypothetical protein